MLLEVLTVLIVLGVCFCIVVLMKKATRIKVDTISAGSAAKENQTAEIKIKGRSFSDTTIDMNNFINMLVCGSSMKYENIEDGDVVMVERCGNVSVLKPHSSIISVENRDKAEKIKHKLRKYIGVFEDTGEIQNFVQSNSLDVQIFQDCYEKRKSSIEELIQMNKKIIVSETNIESANFQKHYSFHSVDSIEGFVKHAIPSRYVEVIKKY